MSLKEKFDKAGLTGTTVALPKGKTKDGSGEEKDYKTGKETKKLVKESQTKDAKVIKPNYAATKGSVFLNKREKRNVKTTKAEKIADRAGNTLISGASYSASQLSTSARVLADAMAKSRETATGVKTPIAATKGSVFVNKGYDPLNKERSERETQNLKSLSVKANDYAKTMKEKGETSEAAAKQGLGKVGQAVVDLGIAGTQLAGDASVNLIAPGAGLASLGARSFGQGMMTAEEQGKTGARALAYAAGTAAIEAGTEKISAAGKPLKAIYGAGFVDDALKKLTEKLIGTSKGRKILAEIGRSAAGEGAEEALADVLQVPLQNLTLQNGAKFDAEWVADTAYDALLGGIMGGVLGTAGNIGAMAQGRTEAKGNAKADVIANAMTQAAQKNAQKNAPPVFQTAQKQTEQPVQQEAPQAGANGNGLTPYTEQEKINLSSGKKNNIISNISDAVSFIKNALSNKQSVNRAYFGKIPDSVADKVLQETGIDIRNYNVILPSDAVRHMFKNHGNPIVENARGQISLTPDLAAQIPEILSAPDKVRLSDKKDAMNRPTLIFEKLMGDYYITAQAVSDGTHSIQTDTLYIRKKNPQDTVSNAETNSSPEQNARNVPPQGSSINNIPSSEENSNNNSDGLGAADRGSLNTAYDTFLEENKGMSPEDVDAMWERLQREREERESFYDGLGALNKRHFNYDFGDLQSKTPDNQFYPEGANAARVPDVPMFDVDGNKISKSASTVLGAKAIPDDAVEDIEQMIADGMLSYNTLSDQESLQRARHDLIEYGFEQCFGKFRSAVNAGKANKDIVTLGQMLLNNAANARDGKAVAELLVLYKSLNNNLAQGLQATSIFRKLRPDFQLYGIEQSVDWLNKYYDDDSRKSLKEKIKKQTGHDKITIDESLIDEFLQQTDQAGRDAVMEKIYVNIAEQIPSSLTEKLNAIRRSSMLLNPLTHIRNVTGNVVQQIPIAMKNEIGNAIERGAKAAGVKLERTKSSKIFGRPQKELLKAAEADFENIAQQIEGSKYSENSIRGEIEKYRKLFKSKNRILNFVGKAPEFVKDFNYMLLEKEDAVFKKYTYKNALAGYLHAHGVTANDFMNGTADNAVVQKAREYAINEAQKATYQDNNQLTDILTSRFEEKGNISKAANFAVDAVLPFRKTPANILARAVEYSPVGLARGLSPVKIATFEGDLYKVRKGEMAAEDAIDHIASGLSGTAITALGAFLFHAGLLSLEQGDDKDDKWAQLLGHQSYALELPDGTSITLGWLTPASLTLFVGAELANAFEEGGYTPDSVIQAILGISDPMLEMSMLQSVNDMIDSVKYDDGKPLVGLALSALTSYFTSFIPTFGGQVERWLQDTRMTSYTDKNKDISTDLQYIISRASSRIPGWDYQQIPYIDAWGQEEKTGTPFMRAFDNFLNPSYVSQVEMDKVEKELQSVRDATGDTSVFPNRAEKEVTLESGKKYLTADEYVKYAKQLGKEKYTLLKDAVNSDVYQSMSAAEKADFISYVYKYARNMTEYDQFKRKPDNDWMLEARDSGDVVGAICDRVLYKGTNGSFSEKVKQAVQQVGITAEQYNTMSSGMDADGNGGVSQAEAKAYLDSQNFSREQKAQLWNIIDKRWKNNPYK